MRGASALWRRVHARGGVLRRAGARGRCPVSSRRGAREGRAGWGGGSPGAMPGPRWFLISGLRVPAVTATGLPSGREAAGDGGVLLPRHGADCQKSRGEWGRGWVAAGGHPRGLVSLSGPQRCLCHHPAVSVGLQEDFPFPSLPHISSGLPCPEASCPSPPSAAAALTDVPLDGNLLEALLEAGVEGAAGAAAAPLGRGGHGGALGAAGCSCPL